MDKIDSHHHFWRYDAAEYPWIDDSKSILKRDFLYADLLPELTSAGIIGVVSVQARQSIEETNSLLEIANQSPRVWGVVGWAPLSSASVDSELERFSGTPQLVGFRHVVQDEPDPRFLFGDAFNRGVAKLAQYDWTYDLLVYAHQLKAAIEFVDRHPTQRMILDHIAKPSISFNQFDQDWSTGFREVARRENVWCKFSGVATEVRDPEWTLHTVRPYWEAALDAFGTDRLMYGSDWPVCLLRTDYLRWVDVVTELASELSPSQQSAFWYENAAKAYRLETKLV